MASSEPERERLALLAGQGELPLLAARAAAERGYEVLAFGFQGMMPPRLRALAAGYYEYPFCQLEKLLEGIKDQKARKALTIGNVAQVNLVEGETRFDRLALSLWRKLEDLRVDTVMRVLVELLAEQGVKVLPANEFLADYMAPPGLIAGPGPSPQQQEDIRFGFKMAKAIGGLDIGQTVVIKNKAVLAVEAVEGTDQTILRAGKIAGPGAVVVKTAKPAQDMRFDVPVAGIATIRAMKKAKAALLALEAGKVIIVDREKTAREAENHGITILGVNERENPADA